MVTHNHILLNGRVCNIPSRSLKIEDQISVRERSKTLDNILSSLSNHSQSNDWLEWNIDRMTGVIKTMPDRSQISENIKEQLIVELYSK